MLFRLTGVLFRLTEVLFRLTGALFRLTEVLFRQHGSSGLGRCYSQYKELSDTWCNMSLGVYLV